MKVEDIWIRNRGILDNPLTYSLSVRENIALFWVYANGVWTKLDQDKYIFLADTKELMHFMRTKIWNSRMNTAFVKKSINNLAIKGFIYQYSDDRIAPNYPTNPPKSFIKRVDEHYKYKEYIRNIRDYKEKQGVRLRKYTFDLLVERKISDYGMHIFKYVLHRYGVKNLLVNEIDLVDLLQFCGLDTNIYHRSHKRDKILKGFEEIKNIGFIKDYAYSHSRFRIELNRNPKGKEIPTKYTYSDFTHKG